MAAHTNSRFSSSALPYSIIYTDNNFIIRKVFDIKYYSLLRIIRVYLNNYKSNLKREYKYYKELYTTYLK